MTKIEEVARAIIGALKDGCMAEDLARAAIEAMREPSEAMISAADAYVHQDNVWRCMIDAALKETP